MFKDLSIKSRMLLLSLLPGSLLGLLVLAADLPAAFPHNPLSSPGLALLVLTLSGLLALRMGRSFDRQLQELQQGLARLQEGQLACAVAPLPSPELDTLANGINRLAAARLSEQQALQQSTLLGLEEQQQARETLAIQTIELELLRQQALAANRSKSDFLTNMNHEIRTPLNGILGFTALLGKTTLSTAQRDHLQTIEQSASNLLGILGAVLDYSALENHQLQLDSRAFNLRDLVQDSLAMLAPTAHEKQLELVSLVYRDTPAALIGDPLRLQQILLQLISNAIKFTAQGSVVVRAMLEDESDDFATLRISVQDSGAGLDPAAVHSLFAAFNQADNSLTRQAGGAGLGLTISQRLIELMGGSIGVDSQPGAGAEFWISLSLAKASLPAEPAPAVLNGRRVAVFDAHALAQQSLQHQLVDCGLDVYSFTCMEDLLQALDSQAISLVVIGSSQREMAAEQLAEHLQQLAQRKCQTLLLCPTTEQQLFASVVPDTSCLLQCKPAGTRKLLRALGELLAATPATALPLLPPADSAPHVLCVDDNPANLLLVESLLNGLGARVTAVESGYAALQAVADETFELILMDIQMPGMNGIQATQAIRQRELELQLPAVPIVALTAHVLPGQKRSLLEAGMDDYRSKPISEQQLVQLVLRWTGKQLLSASALPVAQTAAAAATPDQPAILDAAEGLRLAAGNADLARDLLAMLLASLAAEQNAIRLAHAGNAKSKLAQLVHRLLGATRYCGVPQLRAACQHSENLLREGLPAAEAALPQLDSAISALLQEVSRQQTSAG